MPKLRAPFVILSVLFANFWAYAQVPDPSSERTVWDHNGSVMYLIANGSSREIFYEKPRSGMVEAGAKTAFCPRPNCRHTTNATGIAKTVSRKCRQHLVSSK